MKIPPDVRTAMTEIARMFGRQGVCEEHDARGTLGAREEGISRGGGGSDRETSRAGGVETGEAGGKAETVWARDVG